MTPPAAPVFDYAMKLGWVLRPGVNVVLEGQTDLAYFRLADEVTRRDHNRQLLGDGFHAVSGTPTGGTAGTEGIIDYFPGLAKMATRYLDADGKPVYRLTLLVDDDHAGRETARIITAVRTGCMYWRDVFLLKRAYPTDTRDLKQIEKRIQALNAPWTNPKHDCEIEDLLPHPLIERFRGAEPGCHDQSPVAVADRYHYEFAAGMKGKLVEYVRQHSTAADLEELIRTIRAIRFFVHGPPWQGTVVSSPTV